MSNYKKTIESKYYWIYKGQGEIYDLIQDNTKERGAKSKLAKAIGKTKGYVSQLISGDKEINPTWKKIVELSLALGKVPMLRFISADEYLTDKRLAATKEIAVEEIFELKQLEPLEIVEYKQKDLSSIATQRINKGGSLYAEILENKAEINSKQKEDGNFFNLNPIY